MLSRTHGISLATWYAFLIVGFENWFGSSVCLFSPSLSDWSNFPSSAKARSEEKLMNKSTTAAKATNGLNISYLLIELKERIYFNRLSMKKV
jgi:hypothetical protein